MPRQTIRRRFAVGALAWQEVVSTASIAAHRRNLIRAARHCVGVLRESWCITPNGLRRAGVMVGVIPFTRLRANDLHALGMAYRSSAPQAGRHGYYFPRDAYV